MFLDIDTRDPKRTAAIAESGETLTYGDLCQCAGRLRGLCGGRCLVFILCDNSLGCLAGYMAAMASGIVPLLLDAALDRAMLDHLIKAYHPSFLLVPQAQTKQFPAFAVQGSRYGFILLKTCLPPFPLYDDLSLLLTTSGSTGSPKLVRHSYENVESNARSIAEYLELNDSERPITNLPMNYTYGLSIVNSHFVVGACLLVTDRSIMQRQFWDFFRAQNATSFAGVPYTYEMLKRLHFFAMDLPSLRYMTQAGGKLSQQLHREFAEDAAAKGRRFIVMYGQTEASPRMGWLPAEKALEKCGSMGIAIPGGRLSIIDVDGHELTAPRVTGELVYYGPNVTLGYAQSGADLALGDERHGRLETGDMAQVDEDGYFSIVGRKKRFLKIYGNRVNLDECEHLVKAGFADIDCACSGNDNLMLVFITDEAKLGQVRQFLAEKTHLNAAAFDVRFIDGVPRSSSGKVQYEKLLSVAKNV